MSFVFNYRGCGKSEGSFSFAGWRDDIKAAVENIWQEYSQEIWIAGFGVGGTLALHAVADDERVHGFAVLGAPVDLSAWKTTADSTKTETTKAATADSEEYSLTAKNQVSADKPLLVIHGQDDDLISVVDARVIADTYGASELRILEEGGHNLRYDPRALALLFGWLDRNRRA